MVSLVAGRCVCGFGQRDDFLRCTAQRERGLGHIGNFCTVVPTKLWFCGMIGHIQKILFVVPRENFAMGRA